MEAIATNLKIGIRLIGQPVKEGVFGHGLMEGSIEYGNHRSIGHYSLAGVDSHYVCGIMQGSKLRKILYLLNDLIGKQYGLGESFAAVNNTMTNGVNLVHGSYNAMRGVNESIEDELYGIRMILHIAYKLDRLLARGLVCELGVFNTYALAESLCDDVTVVNVYKLIFKR